MIAICDANSFYAASERLFIASLWDKPVVVLSNNMGVVVSLNQEAKKVGVKRGMVYFQHIDFFKKNNVHVFPSNYTLYDDISDRVMLTLNDFVEQMEIYSVDEAWLNLKGYEHYGYTEYGQKIIKTVKRNVGISVSMGIAQTKTLAKIANRFSKKYTRFNGVFIIDSELKRVECLKRTKIGDVWGIGYQLAKRLNVMGIFTAYDFTTKMTHKGARKLYNIELERTWYELQGIKCYGFETNSPDKKTISTTRSFSKEIMDLQGLKEAVSTYAAICASDLRRQGSFAASIQVELLTNRFKDSPQYNPFMEIVLPVPANTSYSLVKYALQALENIYIEGFSYKKAGVIVTKITDEKQTDLFQSVTLDNKYSKVNPIEDFYAHGFDRKLLSLGVMGYGNNSRKDKEMNRRNMSNCWTTNFNQIMQIDCTK